MKFYFPWYTRQIHYSPHGLSIDISYMGCTMRFGAYVTSRGPLTTQVAATRQPEGRDALEEKT